MSKISETNEQWKAFARDRSQAQLEMSVRHKDLESGVEFVLSELGTGQMFGEMALITGKPRTASVVAIESSPAATG